MKITERLNRFIVMFSLTFFLFNLAMPVVISMTQGDDSYLTDQAFAEEEEEEGEEEEEAGIDPAAALSEGYVRFPEIAQNPDNPNVDFAKDLEMYDIPVGKFGLFGLSNRDIVWIVAQLHILFASFILACPMFILVSEACGAEKTAGVKKACALIAILAGVFAGSIFGMIGEVVIGVHHAVMLGIWAGVVPAVVVSVMVISGSISDEEGIKKGLIFGAVIGAVIGGVLGAIKAHNVVGGLVVGLVSGILGGVAAGSIICAKTNEKLERLAHECMKVVSVCYSFTALTGGFFALLLIAFYPSFITWLVRGFNSLVTVWYPIVFIVETVFMYLYYYSWDPLNNTHQKGLHLFFGTLLNVSGVALMVIMDAPAGFMLTPTKIDGSVKGIAAFGEWAWINNFTWWAMNFHRLIGNLTYGGFIVAFMGALMYLWASKTEDREFYDWQGYVGNALGLAFMLPLPVMGYIYAKECYMYDAAIGMYIMSDRLSMFMLMQGLIVGTLFVCANFYIWISMKRVTGHEKYLPALRVGFVMLFVCAAVWYAPRHFFATMMPEGTMIADAGFADKDAFIKALELPPGPLNMFALMQAKNTAAISIVTITLVNYILYRIACKKGDVAYGKINPLAQYLIIFVAFADIWLMTLMGAIRELARKNFHVYKVVKDLTSDAFTPTLAHAANLTTVIVWMFFTVIAFIVWGQLKYVKSHGGH